MSHDSLQTVLFESNLGHVGNYGPTVSLARLTTNDSLHAGRLFLRATLDEIIKIRSMSRNLDSRDELLQETTAQYDHLVQQKRELDAFEKRNWLYRLINSHPRKRATRAFAHNAFELWDSTTTTSDTLKRHVLSTRSTDLQQVKSDSVAKSETISGLAVDNYTNTPEAIDAVREIGSVLASMYPSPVPAPADTEDGQSSTTGTTLVAEAPSSAGTGIASLPGSTSTSSLNYLSVNINYNIINNADSTAPGLTINNGSGGSGSNLRLDAQAEC